MGVSVLNERRTAVHQLVARVRLTSCERSLRGEMQIARKSRIADRKSSK